MAGLWDGSTKEDGAVIESCAVITLPANQAMNLIQNTAGANEGRMPAILQPADQEAWLHGTPEQAFACLTPYEDELTIGCKVSARVNSPKSNDAGLVDEVA